MVSVVFGFSTTFSSRRSVVPPGDEAVEIFTDETQSIFLETGSMVQFLHNESWTTVTFEDADQSSNS